MSRTPIPLTYDLARAAGHDAGTRRMRAAGRTCWNEEDYHAAVREYMRLAPEPATEHDTTPGADPIMDPETASLKTHRVITLTDRAPVRIRETDWPTIAYATLDSADASARLVVAVRRHVDPQDGRAIVYGIHERPGAAAGQPDRDRAGLILTPGENLLAAIRRVGDTLITHGADRSLVDAAVRSCVADLPAEDL